MHKGREIYCVRLRTKLIRAILKAKNEFCPHVHVEECIVEVITVNLNAVLKCLSHSIKYLSSTIANRDPKDDPDLILGLTHSDGSSGKREFLSFSTLNLICSSHSRSHNTAVCKKECKETGIQQFHHKASQSHVPIQ